ncbi:hypothetical protein AYK26_02540 [Euryarchaeota archaeon SM23-78]|nr:MAG: hypothetical protein AYK26_02540 [Euryarchaeota archaeon SM23-78]MBW3000250.1 hypothetical protein [Candidatus Woesearchaeota archaeon]
MPLYLIRYSEIGLKGRNRAYFEKRLVENIRTVLKDKRLKPKIKRLQGRLLLDVDKEIDLKNIFGISSYSPCIQTKAELKKINSESLSLVKKNPKTKTFRISARRLDKRFALSSLELNNKVGAFIVKKTKLKVSLEKPDLEIGVEIINDKAFIFCKTLAGFGGLPVGVEGKALCLVSDKNSVLAGLLLMKRGCSIITVEESKIKNLKELDELAKTFKCRALIVPDTLQSLKDYPIDVPVLRPLIAFSEQEIKQELEKYKSIL